MNFLGTKKSNTKATILKQGFIYYLLSTAFLACQFLYYIHGGFPSQFMDIYGWVFYFAACISHAALFTLIPYLVFFFPLVLFKHCKWALSMMLMGMIIIHSVSMINTYVFNLYHFFINGFVLAMFFGEGASEIFVFSFETWLVTFASLFIIGAASFSLLWLSRILATKKIKHLYCKYIIILAALTIGTNLAHVYAKAAYVQSIVECTSYIPYYYPLEANRFMARHGIISKEVLLTDKYSCKKGNGICYPIHPLKESSNKRKPMNVIILAIDSWNKRSLTSDCMPNIYKFAQKSEYYNNHRSSSNGTRGSVFGMFYGVSPYYWKDFETNNIHPVIVHECLKHGYYVQAYPSAPLYNPPFAKNVFKEVKNLNVDVHGTCSYESDSLITEMFIKDLNKYGNKKPMFSFIFYDLNHAMSLSPEKNTRYKTTWNTPDYTSLNNNTDPTNFWNLYRNCSWQIDRMVGRILKALETHNMLKNTIVIITGDHGQEFNENHKNYWGHGGNFSQWQNGVPFIYYYPGCKHKIYKYRTTHYDITATLMPQLFGIKNPSSDYSFGRSLHDKTFRNWHIVGSDLTYAFIIDHDIIIEKKPTGFLEITDGKMNLLKNYHINVRQMNDAIINLNRFYKK